MKKLITIKKLLSNTTFVLLTFLVFQSCKKAADITTENTSVTATPASPQIQINDADAILVNLQTVTYTSVRGTTIETAIGLPVAMFFDGTNFKNVGSVTCEGKSLTKQDNHSYIFVPSATDPLGVTYDNTINWAIAGDNGFPGGTYSVNSSFPNNVEIDASNGQNIDSKSAFTLATKSPISNADSVYFGIYGPSGAVNRVLAGNVSSYTFSESEMNSIGAGIGFMQIAAVKHVKREMLSSNEVVYHLTEKVNTTSVTFK